MHAVLRQPGVLEDVCAFLPVSMRVDRPPLWLTPDQTLALPTFAAAMRPRFCAARWAVSAAGSGGSWRYPLECSNGHTRGGPDHRVVVTA